MISLLTLFIPIWIHFIVIGKCYCLLRELWDYTISKIVSNTQNSGCGHKFLWMTPNHTRDHKCTRLWALIIKLCIFTDTSCVFSFKNSHKRIAKIPLFWTVVWLMDQFSNSCCKTYSLIHIFRDYHLASARAEKIRLHCCVNYPV